MLKAAKDIASKAASPKAKAASPKAKAQDLQFFFLLLYYYYYYYFFLKEFFCVFCIFFVLCFFLICWCALLCLLLLWDCEGLWLGVVVDNLKVRSSLVFQEKTPRVSLGVLGCVCFVKHNFVFRVNRFFEFGVF